MNLDDFESRFDGTILERARNYYKGGRVITLEPEDDYGLWEAEVEGSELYAVTVVLDGREVVKLDCACPYDLGDYCKHQGAVLFALREKLAKQPKQKSEGEKPARETLESSLNRLSKDDLVSLLLELAGDDKRIKKQLKLRFADKSDLSKYSRDLIKGSIQAVKRDGYISYCDNERALGGARKVLETAAGKIAEKNFFTAVELCFIVLEETANFYNYCDDEVSGDLSEVQSDAEGYIGEAVFEFCEENKDCGKLFDLIYNNALKAVHDDWRAGILTAAIPLCKDKAVRAKFESYLEYNGAFTIGEKNKQRMRLNIIKEFDNPEAADTYINEHLENNDFRGIAINKALEGKQYEKAIKLCLDGEKSGGYGARAWKEMRYRAYGGLNDTENQKLLAKEFLFDGNFDYFHKLKALYGAAEWDGVLAGILESPPVHIYGIYVKIIVAEKLTARLLDYCKKNINEITAYWKMLLPEYPDEVDNMFKRYIFESAESANGRGGYGRVCDILRLYQKAFGAAVTDIRDKLKEQYKKRPAFLDELGKIK